jgi:hypothetical protein
MLLGSVVFKKSKDMLSAYKLTISIAMGNANLSVVWPTFWQGADFVWQRRTASVSAEVQGKNPSK